MKKVLVLFIILSIAAWGAAEIKNKMVIDYGNFLNIQSQKELHSGLEYIYNQTGVYISIVTVDNPEKYNIESSITEYVGEINSHGIYDIIILLRTKNEYRVFLYGGADTGEIKKIISEMIKEYETQQGDVKYYSAEFGLMAKYLSSEPILKIFKANNKENSEKIRKTKIIVFGTAGVILILLAGFFINKKRKEYLIKTGVILEPAKKRKENKNGKEIE